jgi:hypothetical protein
MANELNFPPVNFNVLKYFQQFVPTDKVKSVLANYEAQTHLFLNIKHPY